MDLYSILNPSSKLGKTSSYHLVQLSSELIKDIKHENNSISSSQNTLLDDTEKLLIKYDLQNENTKYQFKSIDELSTPFLTTLNSTFKLRQQNHSNCVMLFKDNINYFNFDNYLIIEKQNMNQLDKIKFNFANTELIELKSFKDIQSINYNNDNTECLTIKKLNAIYKQFKNVFQNTPISIHEFDSIITQQGYIPNFDQIITINTNLEMSILNLILSFIDIDNFNSLLNFNKISEIIKKTSEKIDSKFSLNGNHLIIRIVTNVLLKYLELEKGEETNISIEEIDQFIVYSFKTNGQYSIIHNKIIKFLTMTILNKEKKILLDDLLIQIRLNLPSNYLPNFEINEILNGFSYTNKIDNNKLEINYLHLNQLSIYKTPQERFNQLFKLKSQWNLEEIQPYISPLNTKGLKIDKFALKYCRVKKAKNKTILLKR